MSICHLNQNPGKEKKNVKNRTSCNAFEMDGMDEVNGNRIKKTIE